MNKSTRHKQARVRMCAACGLRAKKEEAKFIRIVRSKEGLVSIDRHGTSEGRGAYVCHSSDCVRKLCRSHRLPRLLRGPVSDELYQVLREEVGICE